MHAGRGAAVQRRPHGSVAANHEEPGLRGLVAGHAAQPAALPAEGAHTQILD